MDVAGSEQFTILTHYTVKWLTVAQFALLHARVVKTLDVANGRIDRNAFENGLLVWLVQNVAGPINDQAPVTEVQLNGHTPVTGAHLALALKPECEDEPWRITYMRALSVGEPWRPALVHALRVMEDAEVLYLSAAEGQYVRCMEPSTVPVGTMALSRRTGI